MISLALQFIFGVILLLVFYFKYAFKYWEKRHLVSYPNPKIPTGHMKLSLSENTENFAISFKEIYNYFKRNNAKHGGIYFVARPIYVPIDLELIKRILITDFESFSNKGLYINEEKQPISAHLFSLGGTRWKKLRTKLTPTFTSGKMKAMFETIVQCSKPFEDAVAKYAINKEEFDIRILSAKFTIDVIGCCAFGLECNSFVNENSDFIKYGRAVVSVPPLRRFKLPLFMSMPKLCKKLGFVGLDEDGCDFYTKIVTETVRYRDEKKIVRNDFINLLMELRNKDNPNDRISLQEIISQSALFFIAGYETSSNTITHALFELAQKPAIQDKLRNEINNILAKHGGKITYDGISEMKYLQQVIDETLRKHPPLGFINRECTKDYQVPGTDVVIEKGTSVFIPNYCIQNDPEYFPKPEIFDPDRFSDEIEKTRDQFTFLAFGQGPRTCIGMRFGYMQTKVGLISLLRNYRIKLGPNIDLPLQYNQGVLLTVKNEVLLTCEKIN